MYKERYITLRFVALTALLVLLFVADIAVGTADISLREVVEALQGVGTSEVRSIVVDIRLVKAIMALLAGAALAVSGLQMQVLFRNPLAGPYVLGVSAGASLGVALFLLGAPLLGLTSLGVVQMLGTTGAAWIGAAAILALIITLSRRIKDIMVILILGMMLSSAIGAIVEMLQYFGTEGALKSYVVWTMGSLGDVTYPQLAIIAPVILFGLGLATMSIKPMNMLLMGEQYAQTMGLNIARTRRTILLATTLLAGTITAFCGPVGFVGIAVPHIARILFGTADHRTLMPATMLLGSAMLLVGDIVAKMLTLPINTVTALMGIPMVIYIVTRNKTMMQ